MVWRGVVYAILMTFAKVCTGLWLIRFSAFIDPSPLICLLKAPLRQSAKSTKENAKKCRGQLTENNQVQETIEITEDKRPDPVKSDVGDGSSRKEPGNDNRAERQAESRSQPASNLPPKPKSLHPACILSLAMVARGEIGYLIASVAESNGIFGEIDGGSSTETYLVIVWAISLCTLIGPISVGTLVKRVRTLQKHRANAGGPDPLGVWGI